MTAFISVEAVMVIGGVGHEVQTMMRFPKGMEVVIG